MSFDALVVTHPFHPLFGKRLDVLFVRRKNGGRLYVCDDGEGRNAALPEGATDRGSEPAGGPLMLEVLADLVAVVVALGEAADGER